MDVFLERGRCVAGESAGAGEVRVGFRVRDEEAGAAEVVDDARRREVRVVGQAADVGFVEGGGGAEVGGQDPQGAQAGLVGGHVPAAGADVAGETVRQAGGGWGEGGQRPGEEAGPVPVHGEQRQLAGEGEVFGDGPCGPGGADQPTALGLQSAAAVDPGHLAVAVDAGLQARGVPAAEPELVGAVEGTAVEAIRGLGEQEDASVAVVVADREEAFAAVAGADRVYVTPVQAAGAPLLFVVRPGQAVGAAARRL
ncbi:hypothetical protein ACFQ7O_03605 [Streptomyces sp. NPDC056485]|uniref:hypothetical protein n=1 Tax=Streptomyces sp. NPDC056485 TaxID=3345834 RepID=UPI0036B64E21